MKKINHLLLITALLITCMAVYSYPESAYMPTRPGSISGWDNTNEVWRPISITASGAVEMEAEITSSVELGSTTIDTLPSFQDSTGTATRALVDDSQRVLVNLGSETVGMVDAIEAVETDVEANSTKLDTVNTNLGTIETDIESVDTNVQAVETDVETVADYVGPATEVPVVQVVSLTADTSQSISSTLTGSRKWIEITTADNTKDFWLDFGTAAVEDACRRVYGGIYLEIPKTITPHVLASESIDLMVVEGGY